MSDIVAGVILTFEYTMGDMSIPYSGYIQYENRKVAIENQSMAYAAYPMFYMDNPEKTSGLFTKQEDLLSLETVQHYSEVYDTAQENQSPMWRPIISFDNRWLAARGLYDPITHVVNTKEIMTATRKCVDAMIQNEKLDGICWTAAIHHNTDNIHVHVSMVQPIPMKDWHKVSPKFKIKSFEKGKSAVVNYIQEHEKEFSQIQNLSREKILRHGYEHMIRDVEIKERLEELYKNLPEDKRLWKYGMNAMKPYRDQIDKITSIYLEKYCKDDFDLLKGHLYIEQERYKQAYGKDNSYAQNQIDDLYKRLGNQILREGIHYLKPMEQLEKQNESWKVSELDYYSNMDMENIDQELQFSQEDIHAAYKKWFSEDKEMKRKINRSIKKKEKIPTLNFINESNPLLLYTVGDMYAYGKAIECDLEKAKICYQKALELFEKHEKLLVNDNADKGKFDLKSYIQYRIGKMYDRGYGTEKDSLAAKQWYEVSDISYARFSLGNMYFYGTDRIEKDYVKAYDYYSKSDVAFAYLKKAEMLEQGIGVGKDESLSEKYYSLAYSKFERMEAKMQNDLVEYNIGKLLYEGKGVEQNTEKAIKYLEMASDKKNIPALYKVSMIHIELGHKEKIGESIKNLEYLANEGNHANAQYILGKLYCEGKYVEKNFKLGYEYLSAASDQGNEYAKEYLKWMQNHQSIKKIQQHDIGIYRLIGDLKNACNNEVQKKLNMNKYRELENEIEYERS